MVRCFSASYKTKQLYRHLLKTDNFVNFLRSMQFSKILYKEPSALGKIFTWSQKFGAGFFLNFINNGYFAQNAIKLFALRRLTFGVFWPPSAVHALACASKNN